MQKIRSIINAVLSNPSKFIIVLIAFFCAGVLVKAKWKGDNWKDVIQSDGFGYYAYLPAIFIYHDLQYDFQQEINKKYHKSNEGAFYCNEAEGKKVNKYFGGEALMLLPFFLLACLFSWVLGYDMDGYSYLFQCAVSAGALFYLLAGLIFLRRFLLRHFTERVTALAVLLIFFGTNLYYYSVFEPSISHVYSFSAVSAFLFFAHKYFRELKQGQLLLSAFLFALIVFLRPANGIIIFALPFLAGSLGSLGYALFRLWQTKKAILLSAVIIFSVLFLQFLLYKVQTGKFIVYSYGEEGFNFLHPEIVNVLFSYRKGFFIYTPLAFIALFGLIPLYKRNKFQFISILFLLFIIVYVISSWWMWFYGGSFGQRAFVEFFLLFAFLLAYLIAALKKWWQKVPLAVVLIFLLHLNLVQTLQKWKLILPWDNMTEQKYWHIFLKTDDKYIGMFTPNAFIPDEWSLKDKIVFKNDFDPGYEWWDMGSVTEGKAFSGTHASCISKKIPKSACLAKKIRDVVPDTTDAFIRVSFKANLEKAESNAYLVISFESEGKSYSWNTFPLIHQVMETDKWLPFSTKLRVPALQGNDAMVVVYVMNDDEEQVCVDDFEIQFLVYPKGSFD